MLSLGPEGLGGVSRQVETKVSSTASELTLPIKHSVFLVAICFVAILMLFADVILIGPWVGVIVVALILLRIALWVYLAYGLKWELAVVPFVILWGRFGYGLVNSVWIPFRPELPGWATVILLSLSVPVYAACYLVGYRMAFEIVDPNWTPPIMPRRPEAGVAWPSARFAIPQVVVREVPRPFAINQRELSGESEEAEGEPQMPEQPTLISPSGEEIMVNDLVRYVRQAPKIGTDKRTWKNSANWTWKYWNGVVGLLGQMQILTCNGKTRFIVTDFNEQMRRISKAAEGP
jgi:hypothetical protein